ncbi:MAG: hypothetical protein ACK4GJ_01795 [bacterium]
MYQSKRNFIKLLERKIFNSNYKSKGKKSRENQVNFKFNNQTNVVNNSKFFINSKSSAGSLSFGRYNSFDGAVFLVSFFTVEIVFFISFFTLGLIIFSL